MNNDSPARTGEPLALQSNDLLGQASVAPGPTGYSIEAVQVCVEAAYKAGQAAEREHVRIPTSAAEAKAMATVAIAWLREHAPDELRSEFRA